MGLISVSIYNERSGEFTTGMVTFDFSSLSVEGYLGLLKREVGRGGEAPFWGFSRVYKRFEAAFFCVLVFFLFSLFVGSTTLDPGMIKSFEFCEYG